MEEIGKIVKKGNIVALTGAGISAESGVPTFRGKGGLWDEYSPSVYANIPGLIGVFLFRPSRLKQFILDVFETIIKARPNRAHYILAEMEAEGMLNSVITQNIDNLHQEADSKKVVELHGNIFRLRCGKCGKTTFMDKDEQKEFIERMKKASRSQLINLILPKCECGGRFRPDVVLFGESLRASELEKAYSEIERADTLLMIGTSGIVYPAASLPFHAKRNKATIIEINNKKTSLSGLADHIIRERATTGLGKIY
jgi:NAD-dependent deacetylase